MRYEEFAPGPAAVPFVDRYWRFALDAGDPPHLDHVIVPDGLISVSVVRTLGGTFGFVAGPTEQAHVVPVHERLDYGGVRFKAGGGLAVPGFAPGELVGRTLQHGDLDPAFAAFIAERLPAVFGASPAAAMDVVVADWRWRTAPDAAARRAVEALMASDGAARIGQLAAEASLSERQLRRRFVAAVGLAPKAFARVRRLRAACILALAKQARLGPLSTEAGYADQAHLSRETLEAFGASPRKVTAYLRRIRHQFAT